MPKNAYDLYMAKQKRLRECDKTVWFTDEKCGMCGKDVITDGVLYWCSEGCIQNGKRGKKDPEGFGFISDLIR